MTIAAERAPGENAWDMRFARLKNIYRKLDGGELRALARHWFKEYYDLYVFRCLSGQVNSRSLFREEVARFHLDAVAGIVGKDLFERLEFEWCNENVRPSVSVHKYNLLMDGSNEAINELRTLVQSERPADIRHERHNLAADALARVLGRAVYDVLLKCARDCLHSYQEDIVHAILRFQAAGGEPHIVFDCGGVYGMCLDGKPFSLEWNDPGCFGKLEQILQQLTGVPVSLTGLYSEIR